MSVMTTRLVRWILRSISATPVTRLPLRELARRGLLPQGVWKRLPVEWPFWVLCTTRRDLGEAALAAHRGGGTLPREQASRAVQNGTFSMAKRRRALERCYDGELT